MMPFIQGKRRFLASTKGKIVALLRYRGRTVDELAQELNLTDNAVRAHLAALERDGLVQQHGVRPGKRKPAIIYNLAPSAEELFPKAYDLVLRQLLEVLSERLTTEEMEVLMQMVGRRLAAMEPAPAGDLYARLEQAVATLNSLGGLAELEQRDGMCMIRGTSCPLASVAMGHAEVCRLVKFLLTELIGAPVEEQCEPSEKINCRFLVSTALQAS